MNNSAKDEVRSAKSQWLGIYLGLALATFVFQIWWRSQHCGGLDGCLPSFAKGLLWSALWPASWAVFFAGLL